MAGEVRPRLDAILDATLAAFPSQGRDLGLHAYDGLVDDLSPAALAARAAELLRGGRLRGRLPRRRPRAEVAMRTDALGRVARLLCAAGMHTQGMTLDEAARDSEATAGLDPDHARLEAVRGTWDPGYFGYTLGKLEILDLRERVGGDPAAFHDRLLALGTPPPAVAARRLTAGVSG
jgi:Bacterial protein of unknown function (DUF885)